MMDVTADYIGIRQRPPKDFIENGMLINGKPRRLVSATLDAAAGVRAAVGQLKDGRGAIQSYLFSKDNWSVEDAGRWVQANRGKHNIKRLLGFAQSGGDKDLVVKIEGDVLLLKAALSDNEIAAKLGIVLEGGVQLLTLKDVKGVSLDDHVELDAKGIPVAFRIREFGPWKITDPRYPPEVTVSDKTGSQTLAYFKLKGKPKAYIDIAHSVTLGTDERAVGHYVPEVRPDGIWATQVDWSPRGLQILADKEIRHFSPEAKLDPSTNHVEYITSVSLTNKPATDGQLPLVASAIPGASPIMPSQEEPMKDLLKRLGLDESATEEQAIAKLDEMTKVTPPEVETAHKEAIEAKDKEIKDLMTKAEAGESDELKTLKTFQSTTLETLELKEADTALVVSAIEKLKGGAEASKALKDLQLKAEEFATFKEDMRVKDLMTKYDTRIIPDNEERIGKLARQLPEALFCETIEAYPEIKKAPEKAISVDNLSARNIDTLDESTILTKADIEHLEKRGHAKDSDGYKAFVSQRRKDIKAGLYTV